MIHISQLETLLELSVGVHLAYSMISDLHWYHFRRVERFYDHVKDFCERSVAATPAQGLPGILWVLKMELLGRRFAIEKTVRRYQIGAGSAAIVAAVMLVVSALQPDFLLPMWSAALILSCACLPMPTFLVVSWISHLRWKKSIKRTEELVQWKYNDAFHKEQELSN